ncbi:MAG: cobalamin B12-binding domain-containing protein [Chloroflexota bacterium]
MESLEKLKSAIIEGNHDEAVTLTKEALDAGLPADDILSAGLIPGIQTVGELFEKGEYYLPELLMSGKAMSSAVSLLEPAFARGEAHRTGRYLIGTVKDDIHDIGKNIVIMMLKGNGWEVTDLGVDISAEEFCNAVRAGGYDILGLSSLLTMTMPNVVETIQALDRAGLRDGLKVMVGGAPVTQDWADRIGADGYARDAAGATRVAANLLSEARRR